MEFQFLILGALIIAGFIALFFVVRRQASRNGDDQSLLMLQNQLEALRGSLDNRLGQSAEFIQRQSSESAKIFGDVRERLAKLDETNRQVVNFADQLQNLQDILQNPKQRGIFGEYQLEILLKNVFPPGMYQMQYEMGADETTGQRLIPDAVIFVKDKIIPIDSKFSLENYNRIMEERDPAEREKLEKAFKQDLKNRIDETAKYVRPEKGTMDFAFMFIPAEGIFYDLLVNKIGAVKTNTRDLIDYAFIEKHVHIVSPTTLLSHLKMLLQGLRALQIEEQAKEIIKRVDDLRRHIDGYDGYMQKLGKNLETTVNTYNMSYKELRKLDKDVLKITGRSAEVEPLALAKPTAEKEY